MQMEIRKFKSNIRECKLKIKEMLIEIPQNFGACGALILYISSANSLNIQNFRACGAELRSLARAMLTFNLLCPNQPNLT